VLFLVHGVACSLLRASCFRVIVSILQWDIQHPLPKKGKKGKGKKGHAV